MVKKKSSYSRVSTKKPKILEMFDEDNNQSFSGKFVTTVINI